MKYLVISLFDEDLAPLHRIPLRRVCLTRAEAVERMAKAMIAKNNATPMYIYKELAQAALDELLETKN